jgi:hypothetical protein
VRTVHDHTSAAAFCTSHGAVVPPRAAAHLAERAGLAAWALASPPQPTSSADSPETRRLLHLLLTIYTADTTYASSSTPKENSLKNIAPPLTCSVMMFIRSAFHEVLTPISLLMMT